MRLTFLGTGSATPSRSRNVSSIALQLPESGRLWLFDCGEGTQHQFLRSPLRLSQVERIFFTHLHGDHLYGLPGLLASRGMQEITTPVTLYGPAGLEQFVRTALRVSHGGLPYPLRCEIIHPGAVYGEPELRVECAPMSHRVPAFGYRITEADLPGHFDVERARALGIPEGPLYGRLKRGETLTLPDGRTVNGAELVGPERKGRSVVITGDTVASQDAVELGRGASVLVHEATYMEADAGLAARSMHATAAGAAHVAREAGAETLILSHFSPRYEGEGPLTLADLLAEAQAIFPNTLLARDLWTFELPRPI